MTPRISETDQAHSRFEALRAKNLLMQRNEPDLTESDTRAKLIDPIFRDVLGWQESEIRRESPAADGFADYVFGADFVHFHVEAKRLNPRFNLQAPGRDRVLKIDGSHLLRRKEIKEHLEQAAKYAHDLGSEVAILTNGDQFIIFRTHLPGRSWRSGSAIVWHDQKDIADDFAYFHALLSRDRVRAGSLIEAFEQAEGITTNLWSPLELVRNPDAELVRNRFWNKISKIVSPLLTDDPEAVEMQDEIIRHCYVRSPMSDQANKNIDALLRDKPPAFLEAAHAKDTGPGTHGIPAFDVAIESDVKTKKPGTYILTGGVGSGKTTFIRRFASVVQKQFVDRWCIWLHVDYLSIGDVSELQIESRLASYTFERMRQLLMSEYPQHWPSNGTQLRELFRTQLRDAKMTVLHGLQTNSPEYTDKSNQLVKSLYDDDATLVTSILNRLSQEGLRVVIVLDNTDQQGERFQEAVFLLSQRLSRKCSALTIVALREEKFFAAYRRGIFDAYGDRRFHIGSPQLEEVIQRRLSYALQKYDHFAKQNATTPGELAEAEQVKSVIRALIDSTTHKNQNIVRMLACVSNGDIRHSLGMFRDFVSSGNTDVDKIIEKITFEGGYTVPFHEFAKSAILGIRRYYKSSVAHVINLFSKSSAPGSSHMTAIRVLARLANAASSPSVHGDGFVNTGQLLAEYRQSFGRADDFIARVGDLLMRGLVESEPPRASSVERTDALRISASGMYYWRYLVRSFAYLDLVFVDTAIASKQLAAKLSSMAEETDMLVRFDRVREFLAHMASVEAIELVAVGLRGGPYTKPLVPGIQRQIELEFRVIRRKVRLPR